MFMTFWFCLQSSNLHTFDLSVYKWSFGVVLYEIFTIGNIQWTFTRLCRHFFVPVWFNNLCCSGKQTLWAFPCRFILHQVTQVVLKWRSLFCNSYILMALWSLSGGSPYPRMTEKILQTYFRKDTECLNHNMWMKNCRFSFFRFVLFYCKSKRSLNLSNLSLEKFQVSDHDEMLEEWPRRQTNFHWVEKSTETWNFSFMQGRLAQAQLIKALNLTALSLDSVVICIHFCEVLIASSCYVTEASTPRKTARSELECLDDNWHFMVI